MNLQNHGLNDTCMATRVCERLPGRRFDCQGDRQARPYNTKLPVFHVNVYCTGEPGGLPGKAAL